MKVYRIKSDRLKAHADRRDNKTFRMLFFAVLFSTILIPMSMWNTMDMQMMVILGGSMLLTALIVGLIYWNNKVFSLLMAENLTITVDEKSIAHEVNMDNESRMNFMHKIGYEQAKGTTGYYTNIPFDQIKSVGYKKGDLLIKGKGANTFTGQNMILVPREIEGFEEIERLVRESAAKKGSLA